MTSECSAPTHTKVTVAGLEKVLKMTVSGCSREVLAELAGPLSITSRLSHMCVVY